LTGLKVTTPSGRSGSTYEGLKLRRRARLVAALGGSGSTYEGLKPLPCRLWCLFQWRPGRTSEGWKPRLWRDSRRVYIRGVRAFPMRAFTPWTGLKVSGPRAGSGSTYEGLKLRRRGRLVAALGGSGSTYEGLKPLQCPLWCLFQWRSGSTYEGLKPRAADPDAELVVSSGSTYEGLKRAQCWRRT